jgi:GT2 family glycosyltransferase
MVSALAQLREANYNPGLIGPVSNMVSGEQLADIGQFQDYKQMMRMADLYRVANHTAATKAHRVRGIFFLITPECLDKIGGFDPRYGLGNFEDDDLGMRAKMAGFTLWYADGAFLYHAGSSTFKELGLNYQASIDRNLAIFLEKWSSPSYELAVTLKDLPPGVDLYVPFRSEKQNSGFEMNLGTETIDLVYQASEGEFAAWLMLSLRESPREARLEIIKAISKLKAAA